MLSKVIFKKSLDSGIYPCPSKRRKRKNSNYEPVGRGFESLLRQQKRHHKCDVFFVVSGGTVVRNIVPLARHFYPSSTPSAPEKALQIAVLFLFYTAIETLSYSHFLTAHNPPFFCKSKTTPTFFDHRQKSHPSTPAVVSFLILTQKSYHNFVFQNLSIIR